ncbi:Cd(II)/Pb(II)-responsive transcriptional regulator [Pollutimonas nitritireducens]|uniref:Cd(II)/Pb(II)-responsive transcriptional regulator n=1 Tax=Pollutimonas nitritireducens TaxID=2045209 RepID=A0A2N4UAZ5_9BURK|nr:Cd(II)/Pb(II)-responsive transcriptional regulator [Pollutimonas nitritireducens]PLC52183.1 Cd(II)/Pb(II)-responsive transcriptional regulator [Pollutimonas nitritireducens]
MKIGDLAKAATCSTETIRFYEREGLLPAPDRSDSNYRTYRAEHVERLRFIRNCRKLDMAHDEIRSLLSYIDQPHDNCGPVNHLLDEHIVHVDVRIAELQRLRGQLLRLREQCASAQPVEDCGILNGLAAMETEEKLPSASHLG